MKSPLIWFAGILLSVVWAPFCPAKPYEVPFFVESERIKNVSSLGASLLRYRQQKKVGCISKKQKQELYETGLDFIKSLENALQLTQRMRSEFQSMANCIAERLQAWQADESLPLWFYIKAYTGAAEMVLLGMEMAEIGADYLTRPDKDFAQDPISRLVILMATVHQHSEEAAQLMDSALYGLLDAIFSPFNITALLRKNMQGKYANVANEIIVKCRICDHVYHFFIDKVLNNPQWDLFHMDPSVPTVLAGACLLQRLLRLPGDKETDVAHAVQTAFQATQDPWLIVLRKQWDAHRSAWDKNRSVYRDESSLEIFFQPAHNYFLRHLKSMSTDEFLSFWLHPSQVPLDRWLFLISGQNLAIVQDPKQRSFGDLMQAIFQAKGLFAEKISAQISYIQKQVPGWFFTNKKTRTGIRPSSLNAEK